MKYIEGENARNEGPGARGQEGRWAEGPNGGGAAHGCAAEQDIELTATGEVPKGERVKALRIHNPRLTRERKRRLERSESG